MKSIDDCKTSSYMRLLLQGPPGSGKTTLACAFPGAYVIDIDVNLAGPIRYRKNHGLSLPLGYDRIDIDDNGNTLTATTKWQRFDSCLVAAAKNPDIKTIIIDSATGLADMLMAETQRKQPAVKDGRQIYMFFLQYSKDLIATLVSLKKHVVLVAHEKITEDAMLGNKQYRLMWPGQFGDYMGAFFTNVWRTEVKTEGFPPKPKFSVRTFQDATHYGLKNDLELPTEFTFDWATVEQKLLA